MQAFSDWTKVRVEDLFILETGTGLRVALLENIVSSWAKESMSRNLVSRCNTVVSIVKRNLLEYVIYRNI